MERNLSVCYCLLALSLVLSSVSLVLTVLMLSKPEILIPRQYRASESQAGESNTLKENSKNINGPADAQECAADSRVNRDDKVYVFAYDVPWEQYQYVTIHGELRGLSIDIVEAVCKHAGKKCQHVVVPIKYCWNAEEVVGSGLLSGWFDSCAVFLKTADRDNLFSFSGSFYKPKMGQFYFRADHSISLESLNGLTVGVRSHWYISPDCLLKHNITALNYRKAEDYDDLYTMLANKTVDIAFVEEDTYNDKELLITTTDKFDCSLGGSGVMHRVNSEIPLWFNPSFESIKKRGIFRDLCHKYPEVQESCLLS